MDVFCMCSIQYKVYKMLQAYAALRAVEVCVSVMSASCTVCVVVEKLEAALHPNLHHNVSLQD